MLRKFLPALLLALAACAAQPGAIAEAPAPAARSAWAFEDSDLAPDPAFRFGRLDNGMRYIVRRNGTPAGQGQVRLLIKAGSSSETPGELGYAHFIEHMAFNGSTHVPEGEMVKLLEREGLAFGADTNASTTFDATLYKLDLPRNDPALLETALMLMRETASELTFDPEAVEREKGVILSEKRERDTFALRNVMERFQFLYPGAHFVQRWPIGTVETVQAADSARLRGLYRRIYTPGNATLVVVGDFDPDAVEAAIKARFASWAAAPTPAEPDQGPVDAARVGLTDIFIDPALSERVTASRNGPWLDWKDTAQTRRDNLLRQIGYGIVNRRLQRIANGEKPPFRAAGFGTGNVFKAGRTTNLVVDTGDGEWRVGLLAAVAEYRRAMEYGFTQGEVEEQLAGIRTSLENTVAVADTRNNSTLTAAALALVQDEQVPTTPESALERFRAFEGKITPEAVMKALKQEALPLDDPLLRFEGRAFPAGGIEGLRAAWNEATATPVERPRELAAAEFGYTDFGTPGTVVEDKVDPRLGIRALRFANGLRLNLKHTDIKHDRINFELNIDGGEMLDTRADPLATAMVSLLPTGGLGKHTYDELQTILAGHSVRFAISSDAETFEMDGTTTRRDLELQLQLMAAGITDPGYRPQGEEQYRRNVANFFASKDATPSSALGNALGGIISDNDPRFSLQPQGSYLALSFARLRQAIGERIAHGAMELALVGDFDEEEAIALVARTLGALPPREPDFRAYEDNRRRTFTADRTPRVIRHGGEANQALLRFTWPTRDDADPKESLALGLLERLVRVELTDVLRERLGQTYSPGVSASQSREYPGYGTFTVAAGIDVAEVAIAREAMIETIASLRERPVDEDTLLRARRPMIESVENLLKTNEGWMSLVDRAQSEPDRIDRYLGALAVLNALTAQDLQQLARRYLDPAQRLEILVLPRERPVVPPGGAAGQAGNE